MNLKIFALEFIIGVLLTCISPQYFLIAGNESAVVCPHRFQKNEKFLASHNKRAVALEALSNVLAHLFLTAGSLSAADLDSWLNGSDPELQNMISRLDASVRSSAVRQALGAIKNTIPLRVSEWDSVDREEFHSVIESWKETRKNWQLDHQKALSETRAVIHLDIVSLKVLIEDNELWTKTAVFNVGNRTFHIRTNILPFKAIDYEVHELLEGGEVKKLEKPYAGVSESMALVSHLSAVKTDTGVLLAAVRGVRDVGEFPAIFEFRDPESLRPLMSVRLDQVSSKGIASVKAEAQGSIGLIEIKTRTEEVFWCWFNLEKNYIGFVPQLRTFRSGSIVRFQNNEVLIPAVSLDTSIPAVVFKVFQASRKKWSSSVYINLDDFPLSTDGLQALEFDRSLYLFTVLKCSWDTDRMLVGTRVPDSISGNVESQTEPPDLTPKSGIDHPDTSLTTESTHRSLANLKVKIPLRFNEFLALKFFELQGTPYLLFVADTGVVVFDLVTNLVRSKIEFRLVSEYGIDVELLLDDRKDLVARILSRSRLATLQIMVAVSRSSTGLAQESEEMKE